MSVTAPIEDACYQKLLRLVKVDWVRVCRGENIGSETSVKDLFQLPLLFNWLNIRLKCERKQPPLDGMPNSVDRLQPSKFKFNLAFSMFSGFYLVKGMFREENIIHFAENRW